MLYTVIGSVARCTVNVPAGTGTRALASTSSCYIPGVANPLPLQGTIRVSSNCQITGSIKLPVLSRTIDAWISQGKDSFSGIAWDSANPVNGNQFTGVKR
jgi:hypothetical protein